MNRPEKPHPQTKKFLFDVHNFDENAKNDEEENAPPPPPTFSLEELAAAKDQSYQKGKADGIAEAQGSFEKQVADILNIIRNHFNILFDEEERRGLIFEKEAVQLACTIFAKAFPALNEQHGLGEVRAVLEKVLETVREQPEILVEVPAAYAEAIQNHMNGLLRQEGGPRCVVRGNDNLGPGQCRMSWVNGTAARNGPLLAEKIAAQIAQVLADRPILTDNEQRTPNPARQDGDGHE